MDKCIFCDIVQEKIPSYRVWENEHFLAFLTISPHQPGHTLLIPKKHTDYLFDLPDAELSELILAAKPLAVALKKAFTPRTGKVGLVVAGMGVPHVHLHLVPMDSEKDLSFTSAKHDVPASEFERNLTKIQDTLNAKS